MPRHPLFVLADDLTGAAEIAAIAYQAGLRAVVHTTFPSGHFDFDVGVFNTETRLLPAADAAKRVGAFAERVRGQPNSGFYKKTDSVLRGPVLAEINACAAALQLHRTVLVPCNPSLGRVIRDGRYYLGGQLLHKTAFVRDPHHPRTTADVIGLLAAGDARPRSRSSKSRARQGTGFGDLAPTATCCQPSVRLPVSGVIVGEADTPADVQYWAGQVDRRTLAAGGADFFRAFLKSRSAVRPAAAGTRELPGGETLLLSGTATPTTPVSPLPGSLVPIMARGIPAVAPLARKIGAALKRDGFASLVMQGALARDRRTPAALTRLFSGVCGSLYRARAFRHLIIAGGATAAAVLDELGWSKLEVVRVWGPGVVTLRPAAANGFVVTLKPGSYAWPAPLIQHFEKPSPGIESAAG